MRPLNTSTWGEEERSAIARVIDSDRVTMGDEVAAFEREYADYCGSRYCVAVNSGSSANLLMVAAWSLRYGAKTVIVPAVGWSTSYSPFQQYGWKLVFVDVDPRTLCYRMDRLHDACRVHKPDLILAINLMGNPCEYDRFPANIPILEDNCEAMGARYMGRRTGSFGVMASHSTYFAHHICTMEGGLITTSDEEFYHYLLSLRSHGWTRHLPERNIFKEPVVPFRFILPGYNVRPTEIQAALGRAQLPKLDGFVTARRRNAATIPYRTQTEVGESSWYGFVIYGDEVKEAQEKHESRPVVTGNFTLQPVIHHYKYEIHGDLSGADELHHYACAIGNSHEKIDW